MSDEMSTARILGSVVLALLSFPTLFLALYLATRGEGWLSICVSCPFWSLAIFLVVCALGHYREANFGCAGGFVAGCLGFAAGFFGPMIFTPDSNQGPLLGIFLTGPLGTLVGMIFGLVTAIVRKEPPSPASDPTTPDEA